jgi:hypothetical protein
MSTATAFDNIHSRNSFLGAFTKLRKAIIKLRHVCPFIRPSVRRSVRLEQLGSHRTEFHEILYMTTFRKTVEKIQVSLKKRQE